MINPIDMIDIPLPSGVIKRLTSLEQVCLALQRDVIQLGRTCEFVDKYGSKGQKKMIVAHFGEAVDHLDVALTAHQECMLEAAKKHSRDDKKVVAIGDTRGAG